MKGMKKGFAVLLALVLCVGTFSVSAKADEPENTPGIICDSSESYTPTPLNADIELKLGSDAVSITVREPDSSISGLDLEAQENPGIETLPPDSGEERGIVVSASETGIKKGNDGNYYYYTNGVVDLSKSGLVLYQGKWYYLENGKWIRNKHAFVVYNKGLFLVANGVVATDKNGLMQDPVNKSDWYYCSAGQVQTDVVGLVQYDGAWFFVVNGKLDTTFSGFVKYDGSFFYVAVGRIVTETSGLVQNPYAPEEWVYLANGQAQTQYAGLVQYDGAWFFVISGILANKYITYVPYNGEIFLSYYGSVLEGTVLDDVDEVIAECNYFRMASGAMPLIKEETLCAAAYKRSIEIKTQFSHTRPNGQPCFTILDEFDYPKGSCGENIAWGQRTAAEVMNAWMNSEGHKKNILNSAYVYIGVGRYQDGRIYWTQIFSN